MEVCICNCGGYEMGIRKRKGKRKKRRVSKPNLLQIIYSRIKGKIQYGSKAFDKYGVPVIAIFPVILLFPAFIIGTVGLFIAKGISNPIVWICTSYVLLFCLKNGFRTLIDSSKYSTSYKSVVDILKIVVFFLVAPTLMTAISAVFKDLDSHVLMLIPIMNYLAFKFYTSVTLLYYSYKGLSKKTFSVILTSIIICVLLQAGILVSTLFQTPIYDFLVVKFGITRESIFNFILLNLLANLIILVLSTLKSRTINNWKEIKLGTKLIRYKHVKGEVKQIYVEGLGRIFFPARKYAKYTKFNDFSFDADWIKVSKKLYKNPEPNETDMMVNNEFLSNPLFRLYYMTHKWDVRVARLFRNCYTLFGFILCWRGVYLLQETGNPVDSHLAVLFGTFLIWAAIFSNIIYLSTLQETRKFNMALLVMIILIHIGHLALNFNVYSKVIVFDIIIFAYFFFSFRYMQKKVKKDTRYDHFNTYNTDHLGKFMSSEICSR